MVSDYLMPQMTGLDLAQELTRRKPGTRIVLLTGFLEDLPRSELFEAGIVMVLKKPLTAAELAMAIHEALEDRAAS